jgi:hypothetical protein
MGSIYLSPGMDHWEDFGWGEVGECKIMGGREGNDVAFASNSFSAE